MSLVWRVDFRFFSSSPKPTMGPTQPHDYMDTRGLFPGGQATEA